MRLNYAIPVLVLVATIAAFFALGRNGYASFGVAQVVLRVVVALPLLVSGFYLHFFKTEVSASIIPPVFPMRAALVVLTGVLEIAGAAGLFVPSLRQTAALWLAVLMVAVFPANIHGAGQVIDGLRFPSVPVRLAMQVVYLVFILLSGYGVPGVRGKQ